MPALDGVRAFAVLAVMAYHAGLSFLPGGFFGVDAFFVLSGFLITSLLLEERKASGGIGLRAFWARRARRLLPALMIVIVAVVLYARFVAAPGTYPDLRSDALSAMFYFANWHFIVAGQNYFVAAGPTSPLLHTWSLAIEEQFYIVWPLVVLLVTAWRPRGADRAGRVEPKTFARRIRLLLAISLIGAAASAVEMAILYNPADPSRVYFGSDTHAQCLLVGTALASAVVLWRMPGRRTVVSVRMIRLLDVVAVAGIAVCAWTWSSFQYQESRVFEGGFAIVAVAVAAVLTAVVLAPAGIVAKALSLAPLRYLGKISYGMYLWHFPLDIALTESRVGVGGDELFGIRTATTIAIATVSYFLVEKPVRSGTFFRDLRALVATPVSVGGTVIAIVLLTSGPVVAAAPAHAVKPKSAPTYGSHPKPKRAVRSYTDDPVRALIVGDSVALTLGVGLAYAQTPYHLQIYNEGIIGCGIAVGQYYIMKGAETESGAPCSLDPSSRECYLFHRSGSVPCVSWESAWLTWLRELHPNVVVLLAGRWETVNRTSPSGTWTDILEPSYAAYIKSQLQLAVRIATSTGARMIIETAPCYDSGEQPDGSPWPEDSAARLDDYNDLVREVGAEFPSTVTIQNLDAVVCPNGAFEPDLNGVPVRDPDGVHFLTPTSAARSQDIGGEYLAPALLPLWESLGHEQEAATEGRSVPRGSFNAFFLSPQ